jgi:hypothetical protein
MQRISAHSRKPPIKKIAIAALGAVILLALLYFGGLLGQLLAARRVLLLLHTGFSGGNPPMLELALASCISRAFSKDGSGRRG